MSFNCVGICIQRCLGPISLTLYWLHIVLSQLAWLSLSSNNTYKCPRHSKTILVFCKNHHQIQIQPWIHITFNHNVSVVQQDKFCLFFLKSVFSTLEFKILKIMYILSAMAWNTRQRNQKLNKILIFLQSHLRSASRIDFNSVLTYIEMKTQTCN